MSRIKFDSQGKLESVDGTDAVEEKSIERELGLKKSKGRELRKIENSGDSKFWSLYKDGVKMEPLKFSNGKTQEDVVREIVDLVNKGKKMIFLHGVCGTGKSAIALNIARVLGKAAIVVPVKNLQKQYEEDYMGKMFVLDKNGKEMGISVITGRDNHDSLFKLGVSCADPNLPETIQINEKNYHKLKEYYNQNPFIRNKEIDDVRQLRRMSIAPSNPYWSPIIPAEYDMNLRDAKKKRYVGLRGREFVFYHRKQGCSYYDQYQSYIDSDVIIFNSAKYKIEVALDRKPETRVDIIDEADEFLDSLSNQMELNLTRLSNSLKNIIPLDYDVQGYFDKIRELISLEEKQKRAIGINEEEIFKIGDTRVGRILKLFLSDRNIESEISLDDLGYANKGVEAARNFIDFFDDTYLTYRMHEDNLLVNLVTTNLSKRLKEIVDKNKVFVFMSGTLHSQSVLEKVFGVGDYDVVDAETVQQGNLEILRTGKEFDCSYRSFKENDIGKGDYYKVLGHCVKSAKKPFLVHVNAFDDLPSSKQLVEMEIGKFMTRDKLYALQVDDKTGRMVSMFKNKLSDELYSTKCSRGVDFPGDICNSMIFTKFPNPNPNGTFWKILKRTHSSYYWEFYKDKARREFLQRLYRALRSKEDHVYVLSPDIRVLNAVRDFQLNNGM